MSRYEIRYNEKLLKHYFYDNELKEQISFDDVLKVIEEQNNQLTEKEKKIESLKNQLEKEACDNLDWEGKCLCLYSMLYETLEKLDPAPNDIASAIQQMTKENLDKQNEQFKTISVCKELMRQVEQKDDVIKQFKEKVEEEADFKEEYYHYWQDAKKEIEELKQTINTLQQNTISASVDDVNFIHELENQIAELRSQLKDQRHQICEKIRYYLLNHVWCDKDCRYVADIDKELDRIEKGE